MNDYMMHSDGSISSISNQTSSHRKAPVVRCMYSTTDSRHEIRLIARKQITAM